LSIGQNLAVIALFRPSAAGVLIAVVLTLVLGLPRTTYRYQSHAVDPSTEFRTQVGTPTWFEWTESGDWKVSPLAMPILVLIWTLPMVLVSAIKRTRYWKERESGLRLAMYALPFLSLLGGMTFSLHYWGFAWSLPSLDSRVDSAQWTAIASFRKEADGTQWLIRPRTELSVSDEPGDTDCCHTNRIVATIARSGGLSGLRDLTTPELEFLKDGLSRVATFEGSDPGYDWQSYISGVFVLGTLEGEGRVAFAAISGGESANDHHPTYEVLFALDGTPRLLSQRLYYGDVAGVEGLGAGWFALMLYVLGLVVVPTLYLLVTACVGVVRAFRGPNASVSRIVS
jgi:hypothetical protein